jgi:AcrR family transcriptional regulator
VFKTTRAEPKRAGSEETRRQILDTALSLFREKGLEATTMREIAAEVGLSLGAAYYYFPTKEAIVAAYYDQIHTRHLELATVAFEASGSLKDRLLAAYHTKLDVLADDQRLLRALFRYGGDPDHPLSWFGPGTRDLRRSGILVFERALDSERLPDDVKASAPTLLWTLHMGLLLYFVYDESRGHIKTRRLIDRAVDFVIDAKRVALLPLMRPVRRRVLNILVDAGLVPA